MIFRSLRAKRGNLQLLWVSHLEIATVACGDLAMTIAAFFNSLLGATHCRLDRFDRQNYSSSRLIRLCSGVIWRYLTPAISKIFRAATKTSESLYLSDRNTTSLIPT